MSRDSSLYIKDILQNMREALEFIEGLLVLGESRRSLAKILSEPRSAFVS